VIAQRVTIRVYHRPRCGYNLYPSSPCKEQIMSNSPLIAPVFLARLLAEFTTAETTGVLLTGSYARGDATEFSDVDLVRYVTTLPEADTDRYTLAWREGWLVSLSCATVAGKRDELARPETAIWAVPGLRQARLLLDGDGSLAALLDEAHTFCWEPLQGAADAYASYELMGLAEEAHKVLAGLRRGDEALALYGTWGLVLGLARAVATQRGVLIRTENAFFQQVQETVGATSAWAAAFRQAAGFEVAAPLERAAAGLRLYQATAALFAPIVRPAHRPVIEATLARIRGA
jgi:hypothetical protein